MEETTRNALIELCSEAFEGAQSEGTWFVENDPGCGVFGTLDGITAEAASRPSGAGKSSLAGHAGHLLFAIRVANDYALSRDLMLDWEPSWQHQTVNDKEWDQLRRDMRQEAAQFIEYLRTDPGWSQDDDPGWSQDELTRTIGCLAHIAYHLGAMRQLRPG